MPEGAINSDASAISEDHRLGELLVELGLVERKKLEAALQIVDQTGLALGRVLVLSQYIREALLDAAIQCQTMLKSNSVDPDLAKRALQAVAAGEHPNLEEALSKVGYEKPDDASANKLGELLIECGLISQVQLNTALKQSEETGLPFGRSLVLSGMISEAGLTATLNAQSLLRNGRVTREQAIKSLKTSSRRNTSSGNQQSERDFYGLPDRRTVLLGELLIAAGTISKPQLSNAIEMSVSTGKLLGQVLVDSHYCTPALLENALQLQEMILANSCSTQDATRVLFLMDREGLPLQQAVQKVRMSELGNNKKVSFTEFLKLLGLITDSDVDKALQLGRENSQLMLQMLLMSEICDANFLHLAAGCNAMMEAGRMTAEHAFILFDYARKKQINVTQAMKELNWSQRDLTESATNPAQLSADAEWEASRNLAEQAFQDGRFADAERLWIEVIRKAEKFGRESARFVGSIERLADVYCRLGHIDRAESLYSDALIIKSRVLPPTSLHIASTVNNLAKVNYFQGKYDQAEDFASRYLSLYKANFPPDHPDVACALQNMATLFHMQNKFEKAEPYYVEALTICKRQLGDQHPTTIRMQQNYARLLQSLRRFNEVKRMDVMASGNVTGSWKAVTVPEDHSLYKFTERLSDD
jgi:tetratricopeptide (TPR) repeat protein